MCDFTGLDYRSSPAVGCLLMWLLLYFVSRLHGIGSHDRSQSSNWCELDSGFTTITDDQGYRHGAHISLTSDGSVWVRVGRDYLTFDWSLVNQRRIKAQTAILDDDMLNMVRFLTYSSYCVLTDLELSLNIEAAWNPSYLTIFDPSTKATNIISIKNIRDCRINTTLELSADKQGILCDGWGEVNACWLRNMPESGQVSRTSFLKYVNFDLNGPDHWFCPGKESGNFYTFAGSYYFAYIKLASCDTPKDSRSIGNEVKLRRHKDSISNMIIIPDPSQSILSSDAIIHAWQIYAQIVSIEHSVYLQVWRPNPYPSENTFTLVGQNYLQPTELRFHERALPAEDFVRTAKGDVLGLYFPRFNPIGWSSVPCGSTRQQHVYVRHPVGDVTVGRTFAFTAAVARATDSCRAYSMQALFANRTKSKLIDSWACPSSDPSSLGPLVRSNSAELKTNVDDGDRSGNIIINTDSSSRAPHLSKNIFAALPPPTDLESQPEDAFHSLDVTGVVVAPFRLMLMVLCGLLLTMLLTGLVSYYKAVRT